MEVPIELRVQIRFLDGYRFYNAFVAGTMALESRRQHLNNINVFPVPDGDTGDNMAFTCRHIAEHSSPSKSIAATTASMADAALMGARGNSGLIMAQFIYGLSHSLQGQTAPDARTFACSLVEALPFAEEALHKPVEGTILTVLRDWSHQVHHLSGTVTDLAALLPASLPAARTSLLETPRKLEILAREHVVDAGAQGLVDFLQGMADFIEDGNLKRLVVKQIPLPAEEPEEHSFEEIPPHRYCTEAIIEGKGLSSKGLMAELSSFGDSVVVGGHEDRYRIHVHTNRPADLFERLSRTGTLNGQKADDIVRQVEVKAGKAPPIALVTDSTCDLPSSLMDKYGIHMIPLKLSFAGSTYLDRVTMQPERVYRILQEDLGTLSTSQPGLNDFTKTYSFLASHHEAVIAVHLSDALSGTWSTGMKAAAAVDGDKIRVINSRNLCSGLGLIVLKAAVAISEGKSAEQVEALIEQAIPRTRIYCSLSTLRYMVRGGRIRPLAGFAANLLNLKPMISVDREGRGIHSGNACGEKGNIRKIIRTFEESMESKGIWNYAVVHAGAPDKAEKLAGELTDRSGMAPAYVMEVSPVLGINSGPGTVAVSMILEG